MSELISQEKLDTAMMPDLSQDTFELNGRPVKIKALKIKHQKQFSKLIAPLLDELAITTAAMGELSSITTSDFLVIVSAFVKNVDILPRFIQILCHNDGHEITDADLDECTMSASEMQRIAINAFRQGGEFEREISDFFESALKQGKGRVQSLMSAVKAAWEKDSSTSIASSKRSAKTTATSSTKSTNS